MVNEFFGIVGLDIFQVSLILIIITVIIIVIAIIVNLIITKKSKEEAVANVVLKNVKLIEQGKIVPKTKVEEAKEEKVVSGEKSVAKTQGVSLKEHLSQKFQPKIEKQLKTKVKLIDFDGKGNQFQALIEVGGVKVLLILDSSGKIIDYKKK